MGNYNPDHKVVLDDMLLGSPLVRPGNSAYYVGQKLCICLYEESIEFVLSHRRSDLNWHFMVSYLRNN
jgi:hypothetical protein